MENPAICDVADIDTGYCNAINVIHAIGAYERAGASAVVIEDKTFRKVTSLAAGRPDDDLWQLRDPGLKHSLEGQLPPYHR